VNVVDHVELGFLDLPEQQRKATMDAIATVVLRRLNEIEDLYTTILDALNLYSNSPTKSFLLDYMGELLGQVRYSGQTDDSYRRTLRVRVLVRLSCGTLPDVARVAEVISQNFGDGRFDTYMLGAHRIVVVIGGLDTNANVRSVVLQLVLDTIGEVDWLTFLVLPQQPFTFDTEDLGWSQGLWTETFYSSF
jgi:hypothetical protein